MSEIGLNINVDSYNNEGIKTIKGNNNAEIYKLYILKNKRRLSLVGKTVKLGYVMVGTTNGDVIENLNITNAEQGEITFPITNRISKKDGVYSCQLAIYGADGFLEHTATFGLTVEANIFTKIAGEIADSKDFTYLENILDKASKLSEKLKENTSSATNANSNLESNITEANNINSKLLENTSTATGLNKNLESNIDLAKEVKETIKDLDTKNTEATSNIGQLTDLNNKAQELSNNINKGLPLNSELIKNVESAKTTNNELIATNNEAKAKKTDLDNSLEEAKRYISSLDDSKNIVQMQLDINDLKSGLKDNQSLEYHGNNITASNTLEGRTENMIIKGQTLNNLIKNGKADMVIDKSISPDNRIYRMKTSYPLTAGNTYIGYINITKFEGDSTYGLRIYGMPKDEANGYYTIAMKTGWHKFIWKTQSTTKNFDEIGIYMDSGDYAKNCKITFNSFMLFEQNSESEKIFLTEYFEGLKSFGEAEKVGDKYKISILSHGKNLLNERYRDKSLSVLNIYRGVQYKQFLKKNKQYTLSLKFKDDFILPKGCLLALSTTLKPNDGDYIRLMDSEGNVINNQIIKESLKMSKDLYITFYNGKTIQTEDEYEDFINKIEYIQIEENQATSYEPYKCDKKDILIKESLRSKDDICDLLYEDNGQVKIDRYIGVRKHQEGDERNKDVLTDKINTVYILDKPVTEIVENCVDIDLDTFGEKTYFNILNSLPGTLDFKVPSNIASIVQNTAREVNNIWDVINNLLVPGILDVNKKVALATIKNNLK